MKGKKRGFSMIELILTITIGGVIASLASANYGIFVGKARRTEAGSVLRSIEAAQQEYRAIHGTYAGTFDELGFHISNEVRVSSTSLQGGNYLYTLSQPDGVYGWYVSAVGNLDLDAWPDVVTIKENPWLS